MTPQERALAKAGAQWRVARSRERVLAAEMYERIAECVASGVSEVRTAEIAGVDRMTVRRALGKL